jgi:hypothetical protein
MWNLVVSGMEHEATISDLTQRLQKNGSYSQLCCPNAVKQKMAICSFLSRLEDNPKVMALIPGLDEYVDWLGGWRFDLTPVDEVSHRSRNVGAGGWRSFTDARIKPPPPEFAELARRMTSTELTKHFNVGFQTIANWRRKIGIQPFRRAPERPQALLYPFLIHDAGRPEHALLRKVNAAVPRSMEPSLRADVCQDLIVGILAGEISEDVLHLPSSELTRRVWKFAPSRYGDRSLDEALSSDGETTFMDMLVDEGRDWA